MPAADPPLRGRGARATMAKQVTEPPRPVRAVRPDAPARVERVLARAPARNPDERFAAVAEFLAALQGEGADAGSGVYASAAVRCIAVLPFVTASPEPENEYLSDGITDELIAAFAGVEGLRVASGTSVFALKGKPQDVRAIGALLGAAWVLEGTVRRAGDRLRISAQLTSTEDGQLLWSERYDRTLADVFAIQEEIARTIVDTLRATSFADLTAPAARRYTQSIAAYGLYLKGRYAWNKRTQEDITDAIGYFEQAIAEDPDYAPAYAGLSDSYALQLDYRSVPVAEGFARAEEYARRALELDETVAEAHASLGWVLFIYDWDWDGAAREFKRAITLDPRYPTAHQWFAFYLAAMGRLDEALVESHTALELDPASVSIRRSVGWAYFYARRYDQARYHLSRAIAMNPTAVENYRILALALAQQGQWAEAERATREAMALAAAGPYTMATLGYVLARAGRRAEAEELLVGLEARSRLGYVSPVAFATLHIALEPGAGAGALVHDVRGSALGQALFADPDNPPPGGRVRVPPQVSVAPRGRPGPRLAIVEAADDGGAPPPLAADRRRAGHPVDDVVRKVARHLLHLAGEQGLLVALRDLHALPHTVISSIFSGSGRVFALRPARSMGLSISALCWSMMVQKSRARSSSS